MREGKMASVRVLNLKLVAAFTVTAGVVFVVTVAMRDAGRKRASSADALQCSHWAVMRVAQLVGIPVDRKTVQELLPYNAHGHNMRQISRALEKLGISTVGKMCSLEMLSGEDCPYIVHLTKPDHFVVVPYVDDYWVHIYDGAGRRIVRSKSLLQSRFGGEVLCASRNREIPNDGTKVKADTPGPRADFETLLVDKMAVAAASEPVEFVYPFRNCGHEDLIITGIRPDCSCVRSEAPQEPIPPGTRGAIKLWYRINPSNGPFSHRAVVQTNDPLHPNVIITAAGYTGGEITIDPPRLDLGEIVRGRPHATTCFVTYHGGESGFDIQDVGSTSIDATVRKSTPTSRRPSELHELSGVSSDVRVLRHVYPVDLTIIPWGKAGDTLEGEITLDTSVKGIGQLSVPVTATIVSPVRAYPSIVSFGKVSADRDARQSLMLVSLRREAFRIERVDSPDLARCTYSSALADEQVDVAISAPASVVSKLCEDGLTIHVRLVNSNEEVSVPVEFVAFDDGLSAN
jgi:hypothetical protein